MKISELEGLRRAQKVEKTNRRESAGVDFKEMMNQAAKAADIREKQAGQGAPPPPAAPCDGVSILHNVNPLHPLGLQRPQPYFQELEEGLNLVEFYAQKLADPSVGSRKMEALIGCLEDRLSTLKRLESDPAAPTEIRPLASDLAVAIGKEIVRFRRGDYV